MARRQPRGALRVLRRLRRVFEQSESALARGVLIRKTVGGIWVPTPLHMVVEAMVALRELGVWRQADPVSPSVDAGTGDGRVLAVIAALDPARSGYGIERDPQLFAQASLNVRALETRRIIAPTRIRLLHGSFCDPTLYHTGGLDVRRVGLFLNYPDGNEEPLARFIAHHGGPETRLCLLTHNRSLAIDSLRLETRHDIPDSRDGVGPPWRLSVYRRG